MRLIPTIIFLLFACAAYASPVFGKGPDQESSRPSVVGFLPLLTALVRY